MAGLVRQYAREYLEELDRDTLVKLGQDVLAELGRRAMRQEEADLSDGRERDVPRYTTDFGPYR